MAYSDFADNYLSRTAGLKDFINRDQGQPEQVNPSALAQLQQQTATGTAQIPASRETPFRESFLGGVASLLVPGAGKIFKMQEQQQQQVELAKIIQDPSLSQEQKTSALAQISLPAAEKFAELTAKPAVKDTRTAAMKEAEFLSDPNIPQDQKDALLQAKKAGSTSINLGSGEFTGQQAAQKKAAIADTQEAITAIDRIIARAKSSPSDVGTLGAVKGGIQTGLEVLSDIGIPVPEGISESIKGFAKSDNGLISGLEPDVQKLITGVARTMQPGGGKLLASSIQRAKDTVGIKGLQGSKQVIEKLTKQREQLINNLNAQKQIFKEAGAKTSVGKPTKNPIYNPATGEFE